MFKANNNLELYVQNYWQVSNAPVEKLTSWIPFKNVHPLDIGESIILGDVEIEAVKLIAPKKVISCSIFFK